MHAATLLCSCIKIRLRVTLHAVPFFLVESLILHFWVSVSPKPFNVTDVYRNL